MRLKAVRFVVMLALAILTAPLIAEAQQPKNVPRIGWLITTSRGANARLKRLVRENRRQASGRGRSAATATPRPYGHRACLRSYNISQEGATHLTGCPK
jgi:hypothetical protein